MGRRILTAIEKINAIGQGPTPASSHGHPSNHQEPIPLSSLSGPRRDLTVSTCPHQAQFLEGFDSLFG